MIGFQVRNALVAGYELHRRRRSLPLFRWRAGSQDMEPAERHWGLTAAELKGISLTLELVLSNNDVTARFKKDCNFTIETTDS